MQTINGAKTFIGKTILNDAEISKILDSVHIKDIDRNYYVDINSRGTITLANGDGSIDGILELPHVGTDLPSKTIAVTSDIPTTTSALTNDSGFITNAALTGYATED